MSAPRPRRLLRRLPDLPPRCRRARRRRRRRDGRRPSPRPARAGPGGGTLGIGIVSPIFGRRTSALSAACADGLPSRMRSGSSTSLRGSSTPVPPSCWSPPSASCWSAPDPPDGAPRRSLSAAGSPRRFRCGDEPSPSGGFDGLSAPFGVSAWTCWRARGLAAAVGSGILIVHDERPFVEPRTTGGVSSSVRPCSDSNRCCVVTLSSVGTTLGLRERDDLTSLTVEGDPLMCAQRAEPARRHVGSERCSDQFGRAECSTDGHEIGGDAPVGFAVEVDSAHRRAWHDPQVRDRGTHVVDVRLSFAHPFEWQFVCGEQAGDVLRPLPRSRSSGGSAPRWWPVRPPAVTNPAAGALATTSMPDGSAASARRAAQGPRPPLERRRRARRRGTPRSTRRRSAGRARTRPSGAG